MIFAQNKPCDHQFTVYVRLLNDTDQQKIKNIVEKVQFKLHKSYQIRNYTITNYPFELTKVAHSEFDVNVKVFYKEWTDLPMRNLSIKLDFSKDSYVSEVDGWMIDEDIYKSNTNSYKLPNLNRLKLPSMGKPN